MTNLELIKKFRPIFIFSRGEKYYPINKDILKGKKGNIKLEDTENLNSPEEPLYYHILEEDEEEIAIAYILIFPVSFSGFFNLIEDKGSILSCVAVVDKKAKILREMYYWNNEKITYHVKTTRPVIFITANDHRFKNEPIEDVSGLRWEPEKVENFKLKTLGDKRLEGKEFKKFLERYKF